MACLLLCLSGCTPDKTGANLNSRESVAYTEGGVLQGQPSKRIYLLSGSKKHYIQTPATLHSLDVVRLIKAVPDETLNGIPEGAEVPALTTGVVQKASTGEVFLLESGRRRYVPDSETLQSLGVGDHVQGLKDEAIDTIPLGTPIEHHAKTPGK
jgi:hypothetical protein